MCTERLENLEYLYKGGTELTLCIISLTDLNLRLAWSAHRVRKWRGIHSNWKRWWRISPDKFIGKWTGLRPQGGCMTLKGMAVAPIQTGRGGEGSRPRGRYRKVCAWIIAEQFWQTLNVISFKMNQSALLCSRLYNCDVLWMTTSVNQKLFSFVVSEK